MAEISKIKLPDVAEPYIIRDKRIPQTTSDDAGKFVRVGEEGELIVDTVPSAETHSY